MSKATSFDETINDLQDSIEYTNASLEKSSSLLKKPIPLALFGQQIQARLRASF